jgi:restriction endonuclease S subunit
MKQDLVSKEYLINYLLVNQELIYKTARGIDQKNIDMDIFKNIPIPVPDKKVQLQLLTKIVEINCDIDKHLKTIIDLTKLKHVLFSGVWKD